jgi:predicted amidophosphoribosyltransferase
MVPAATTAPTAPAVTLPPPGTAAVPSGHGFCSNCGAEHDVAAHYCEACGQPFAAALEDEQHKV